MILKLLKDARFWNGFLFGLLVAVGVAWWNS